MPVSSKPPSPRKPHGSKAKGKTVQFPDSRSSPLWLLRLCHLQQRFSIITWLLVVAMLSAYGWTVYSQQKWSQAYSKLEKLQIYERQLTSTNEVLKNKLAIQAEQPDAGLVPPNAAAAIVLQPDAATPNAEQSQLPNKASAKNQHLSSLPMGY